MIYVVVLVSRYMEEPKQEHFKAAKRILRYVKGSIAQGLFYTQNEDLRLAGYTDSHYSFGLKSTSGYAFNIGSTSFSWSSEKQLVVALPSCEVECIAAAVYACQAI